MDDLIAFLHARLDEDEQVAKAFQAGDSWYVDGESGEVAAFQGEPPADRTEIVYVTCDAEGLTPSVEEGAAEHIARHDPAHVLREVDARQRILDEYEAASAYYGQNRAAPAGELHGLLTAIKLLALPYADHPDYQEQWKP